MWRARSRSGSESALAFCVAMIDIDGFKKVNDNHGHLTGDELLKQFGAELRSACRATDVIGRWGGDEFILIYDCGLAEAEAQTERLRKWICGNYEVKGKSGALKLRVDASIGLAAHVTGEGVKELVARADAAMYEQKAASRRNGNGVIAVGPTRKLLHRTIVRTVLNQQSLYFSVSTVTSDPSVSFVPSRTGASSKPVSGITLSYFFCSSILSSSAASREGGGVRCLASS